MTDSFVSNTTPVLLEEEPAYTDAPFCSIYRQWLDRMLKAGGPTWMEGVAWSLVRAHGTICPTCGPQVRIIEAGINGRNRWS
jgi:hypothetical protein